MPSTKPGDIFWKECKLINAFDNELDILALVLELNLYEDIYSPSLSGVVTIIDTHNLIGRFPIIGEEKLKIEVETPNRQSEDKKAQGFTSFSIKQTFRVYKVANRKIEMNKQVYQLFFFSEEAYKSHGQVWSLPFSGTSDQIINQIVKEKLESQKPIVTGSSSNFMKFVSPYWSPFECIKYVATHALAPTTAKQADYLFFETNRDYKFESLSVLKGTEVSETYYYDHSRAIPGEGGKTQQQMMLEEQTAGMGGDSALSSATTDISRQMASIIDVRYITLGDWVERLDNEAVTKLTLVHDLVTKKVDYLKYDIEKHYDEITHLGGALVGTRQEERQDKYRHYVDARKNPPTMDRQYNTGVAWSYHQSYDELKEDWSAQARHTRRSYLSLNEFIKLDIDIWGNTALTVGDCIWINFGKLLSNPADKDGPNDPVMTGKYMIAAIAHRMAPNQHLMTMRVVKDSVGVDLEDYVSTQYPQLQGAAQNKPPDPAQAASSGKSQQQQMLDEQLQGF
jgi:hypothetical protein